MSYQNIDLYKYQKKIGLDKDDSFKLNNYKSVLENYREENSNYKVNILLGKIYLILNEYELSKNRFLEALIINPNSASPYYNLFKLKILNKDYIKALKYIKKYKENMNNDDISTEVFEYLLNELILLKSNQINKDFIKSDKYHCPIKNDDILKESYIKIIQLLNDKEYINAKELLTKMQQYCQKNNIFVSFDTHIDLVNEILKTLENIKTINVEEIYELDKIKFKNKLIKEVILCEDIQIFIKNNKYEYVKEYLNIIKESISGTKYNFYARLINGTINEKEEYDNLDENVKSIVNNYLENGIKERNNENYDNAIIYFEGGLNTSNLNIFNYHLGKSYYLNLEYKKAIKYLSKYLEKDGSAYPSAIYYLASSYRYTRNYEIVQELIKELKKINKYLNKKYDLNELSKKVYTSPNSKPKRLLKAINLSEEDFK